MKNFTIPLLLLAICILPIQAQKVSNYSYILDNGIVVKMDNDWGNVWVQQSQDAFKPSEPQESVVISVRTMGDLTQGTAFKLLKNGKSVSVKNAAPGTYDLSITSQLSGKPGTLSFDVNGIVVKAKMKTTVTITVLPIMLQRSKNLKGVKNGAQNAVFLLSIPKEFIVQPSILLLKPMISVVRLNPAHMMYSCRWMCAGINRRSGWRISHLNLMYHTRSLLT